jgi:primosomal protein N' (replication factor Y)
MDKLLFDRALIFRVAIAVPVYRLFDYLPPETGNFESIKPGVRIEVPFGNRKKIAFLIEVVEFTEIASEKLKRVCRVLDTQPLIGAMDLKLLYWASQYYHHPLGEVIHSAFPAGLRQGKSTLWAAEKLYSLTASGQAMDSALLKRSPKQKLLLEKIQGNCAFFTESELSAWGQNFQSALKQLMAKQLVKLERGPGPVDFATSLIKQEAPVCNRAQQQAIDLVCRHWDRFAVFLLEGVTGSGKTEVYMQLIHAVLKRGSQVLVLLPEITLTPQLQERFSQRFAVPLVISHSKLTDGERQRAWLKMQQGAASIMLGTRSALFTPLKRPGLIILDEEHDSSFKQQEGFRFSARDAAVMRGKLLAIPVVLGSATPSLESLHNAEKKRYRLLLLPERAGEAKLPHLQLLDIRNKKMHEGLSQPLLEEMRKVLAKNEQVLLFLNRRGFAPTLICHDCGWVARCRRCDANLVIYLQRRLLRCHHCGCEQPMPENCPACLASALTPLGLGTERVENCLLELFPTYGIVRMDRDSTQHKGSLQAYLKKISQGQAQIMLGTQMLAKGHHFPKVTLVAILDVDSGLFSIDFHASEKLAQLIIQVAGRSGRADKKGKVILQTRRPENSLLTTLIEQGYNSYAQKALTERKEAGLPPFSYQALLRAQANDAALSLAFLDAVSRLAREIAAAQVQILGPAAAPMAKRAGVYRFQLLFQSASRRRLHSLLTELISKIDQLQQAKKVRWTLDVDPVDLF